MPTWIYVCCRDSLDDLRADELKKGITDGDSRFPAGVDYATLAEDYPVGELDADALGGLRVNAVDGPRSCSFEVSEEDPTGRPISIHMWDETAPDSPLQQLFDQSPGISDVLQVSNVRCLVGIQLWRHQLENMGVVFAYEVARYLGQRGRGIVLNDEGEWLAIDEGGWDPTGVGHPLHLHGADDGQLNPEIANDPDALLDYGRRLFFQFDVQPSQEAALVAAMKRADLSPTDEDADFADALVVHRKNKPVFPKRGDVSNVWWIVMDAHDMRGERFFRCNRCSELLL